MTTKSIANIRAVDAHNTIQKLLEQKQKLEEQNKRLKAKLLKIRQVVAPNFGNKKR